MQITREARLSALAMAENGKAVAVGDECGKIFLVQNVQADAKSLVI